MLCRSILSTFCKACVGSMLEASANACLPPPPLVQLVPQSVLMVSDGAFARFTQLRRGFGVFQLARNERYRSDKSLCPAPGWRQAKMDEADA
jgi:hypothetical protein